MIALQLFEQFNKIIKLYIDIHREVRRLFVERYLLKVNVFEYCIHVANFGAKSSANGMID
jgi:hypothetical protein